MPTRNDPFNIKSLDPALLALEPPEPFSLLAPGCQIRAGDIKCLDGEVWNAIEAGEVNHDVPDRGLAYARACPPEMYVGAMDEEIIEPNYLMWCDTTPEWSQVPSGVVGQSVRDMMLAGLAENVRRFFAKPDPASMDQRIVVEVPPRHRVLWPGEKMRRGDKVIYGDHTSWQTIPETMPEDAKVPAMDESNNFARYCRPTGPHFQSWYVSEGNGKVGAMGGYEDPFDSIEVAQQTIEAASKKVSIAANGMIFDMEGKPLMAYDIPAPQPDPIPAPRVEAKFPESAEAPTLGKPDALSLGKPDDVCQALTLPGSIADMARQKGLEPKDIHEAAEMDLNTKYRVMEIGEETKPGDLWYGPMDGDHDVCMWQPCPPELLNFEPGDYLFARKRAPVTQQESPLVQRLTKLVSDAEALAEDARTILAEASRRDTRTEEH